MSPLARSRVITPVNAPPTSIPSDTPSRSLRENNRFGTQSPMTTTSATTVGAARVFIVFTYAV